VTARRIIIDTDPGVDDAIAILLALASPELEVLGLTAVAGNVPLDLTESNARRICELAGRRDIKVFAGCARPLRRPLVNATVAHGETGLNGARLPAPTMATQPGHAVDWLVERVMSSGDQEITLCALGPLTNIATAFRREPRMARRLREIIIMGGADENGGNVTPAAEFNLHVDPEAAAEVFAAGCKITLVPLELTQQVMVTRERLAQIRNLGSRVSRAVTGLLEFYNGFDTGRTERESDALHDPCVIAYLLRPNLFAGSSINIAIETESADRAGMTIMDWRGRSGRAHNCSVLQKADGEGLFRLLMERLATYRDGQGPAAA
jgi:purine nucleosidase